MWFSPRIPAELAERVRARYPSVPQYRDRGEMLAEHPLTARPEFRSPRWGLRARGRLRRATASLLATTVAVGLLPPAWTTDTPAGAAVFLTLLAAAIGIAGAGIVRRSPQLVLLGVWQLGWLVSLRSILSLLALLAIAGWLAAAWWRARRIGVPILPQDDPIRRRPGQWLAP